MLRCASCQVGQCLTCTRQAQETDLEHKVAAVIAIIRQKWPQARVRVCGSLGTGLAVHDSNLKVVVLGVHPQEDSLACKQGSG